MPYFVLLPPCIKISYPLTCYIPWGELLPEKSTRCPVDQLFFDEVSWPSWKSPKVGDESECKAFLGSEHQNTLLTIIYRSGPDSTNTWKTCNVQTCKLVKLDSVVFLKMVWHLILQNYKMIFIWSHLYKLTSSCRIGTWLEQSTDQVSPFNYKCQTNGYK